MGVTERKNREKRNMRAGILNASMKLFLKDGYDKVSLRKIADEIEYSPATVYNYFKDKDEILYSLHNTAFEKFYFELSKANNIKNPLNRLKKLGKLYIDFALNNPKYYDLMFIMRSPIKNVQSEKDWVKGHESFQILRDCISDCIKEGYLRKTNADTAAFAMWSFVHGVVSLIIRKRCVMIPEEYLETIANDSLKFLFNMIIKIKKI